MDFFLITAAFWGLFFKPEQSPEMSDTGRKQFARDIICRGIPP